MDDYARVEDMPLILQWNIRHQFAFLYEVATAVVRPLLPDGLQPYEARPGVALMFMGYNDYFPGNVIYGEPQPAFQEITRFFLVHPDLSVDMRMPRFTMFVHRVGANNAAFIRQERERLKLPAYDSPTLEVSVNDARNSGVARDAHGVIQEWRNTHPRPRLYDEDFWGQYYTVRDGRLWFGVWHWEGRVCSHQFPGDGGGIHEHPFLTGVDHPIAASAVGASYLQMFTSYGEPLVQRFYEPRLVRELA